MTWSVLPNGSPTRSGAGAERQSSCRTANGRSLSARSAPRREPTALRRSSVYGHFDVQPPAPLDLWESDPFEATIRDEWVYARGVADDKGQLWMLLHAAGQLAAEGALPINIRIVSDGEEEVGGQSIVEFLEQDERGADACVIFDGGMESPRSAGALDRHPRPRGVQHPRAHRPARPPLRDVRQRRDERDSRADGDARRHPAARRPRAGGDCGSGSRRSPRRSARAGRGSRPAPDVLRDAGRRPVRRRRRPRSSTSARRPSPRWR